MCFHRVAFSCRGSVLWVPPGIVERGCICVMAWRQELIPIQARWTRSAAQQRRWSRGVVSSMPGTAPLGLVGVHAQVAVPCMTIPWQIAQIHAVTAVLEEPIVNDRTHDLVDMQLLVGLLPNADLIPTRSA